MNKYLQLHTSKAKPLWLVQALADLIRHEGFREFAYPDPLSLLGKRYSLRKWQWGFVPGDILLARYGENERDGRPWTIGYGFTRTTRPHSRISKEYADRKLETELLNHLPVLDKLVPEWILMPLFAQTVLINLAFNLGYERLSKFAPTLQLFRQRKYAEAGARLRKSAWYKQVGARAVELVKRLETGLIDPQHLVVHIKQPDFSNVTSRVTSTEDIQGE